MNVIVNKPYTVDGKSVSGRELIAIAEANGYEPHGGFYSTSAAAKHLRSLGYTVGESTEVAR